MNQTMNQNQKYWTHAAWTDRGLRVESCTWTGDLVDRRRQRKGMVFLSERTAQDALVTGKNTKPNNSPCGEQPL